MKIDLGFFQLQSWKREHEGDPWGSGVCVRFFGIGFAVTNSTLSFSERSGYRKFYSLPFGYRIRKIKRIE